MRPLISIVLPAYDAEQTLDAALDSLEAQTLGDWEAVVVDDGSTDRTAAVAAARAARDSRVRVVRQANAGVSSARNAGIAAARADWLAFLDADDWLAPEALETLHAALVEQPRLDAVHCGWTRIAPDGRHVEEICPRTEEDMFSWHAHNCAFAIHAVLVRRELVERAGGFDVALTTCEDWDLWLRLSRLGARWGRVDAQLAFYRMRKMSASMATAQLLTDGLAVVDRAHWRDERLAGQSHPREDGEDAGQRSRARLVHAVYASALAIGQGEDAVPMLTAVAADRCDDLGADQVAYALFEGVALGAGTIPSDWPSFDTELVQRVWRFLDEVERIAGAPELAPRTKRMLERLVAEASPDSAAPEALGSLFGRIEKVAVDLERPLADLVAGRAAERLIVEPRYGSLALARVELTVCDGHVSAAMIADAVAAVHAWALLGEFFQVTAPGVVHDEAGWELLLREVWGDPEADDAAFYDARHDAALAPAGRREAAGGWAAIELSDPLPELTCDGPLRVVASIGGATLAAVAVEPVGCRVAPGALRREICTQGGFELCRLAVRQGLIGRSPDDGVDLRARLREAAAALAAGADSPDLEAPAGVDLGPGWQSHAIRARRDSEPLWAIARRRGALTGLSGSRLAELPRAAARSAIDAARAVGDPVIAVGAPGPTDRVVYLPDVVWHGREAVAPPAEASAASTAEQAGPGRAFFETLFAGGEDPWRYTSEYEQGKYDQTLSLIPARRPRRALELACAEGHFTRQLAARVERLAARDVSTIALQRARERCADLDNVTFGYHDLFADAIDGRFDLIVCSEVLYYAGDRARLDRAARAIAGALEPGGTLLAAHANLLVDDPDAPGFDWDDVPFGARVIGEALERAGLDLVRELANPVYRVQAYARRPRRLPLRRPRPQRAEAPLPAELPADVEQRFRWRGGEPSRAADGAGPVTWELPILMYHRVAPSGSARLREWRVTPDELEAQLHYLSTAGFSSVSFDEWRAAAEAHRPLPGRRVMLTFDDGYEDFAEHAHPLLRRYRFDATVFLVAERVGTTNEWDRGYGETLPLMGWDTIRDLDGQGVEFGGHSASHPMLTALALDEVVSEASRCRAELVDGLGHLVRPFAYPYGDFDEAVARTIGACGFEFAVTTDGYRASAATPMLALPRINVDGRASFDEFVKAVSPSG